MSTQSMDRRLDKLGAAGNGGAALIEALEAARRRAKAWYGAGSEGPVPLLQFPDLPVEASRAARALYDAIAAGRARVAQARCGTDFIEESQSAQLARAPRSATLRSAINDGVKRLPSRSIRLTARNITTDS